MKNEICRQFKQLKMSGLAKEWEAVEFVDKEQYIYDLLKLELSIRDTNRKNRYIKTAGFKVLKLLEDFNWTNNINIPESATKEELCSLSFIEQKENLVMMGSVGTGKTHLATSLALDACKQGISARFYTAAGLANILIERNKKGGINSFLNGLKTVKLLVIDEIGFVPMHKDGAELLFQVISDCYERRSLIITSNLEFSQWNTVFGDNRLTAALIDRLVHHSHILVFSGESFRLRQSKRRQQSS